MADDTVRKVTDPTELAELWSAAVEMVEPPLEFSLSWLESRQWVVAPADTCEHLSPPEADRLEQASRKLGHAMCHAVVTLVQDMACEVQTSARAFLELSEMWTGAFFVLFPPEKTFAVLFLDAYKLYAGPPDFVETAVGCSAIEARRRFEEDNESLDGSPRDPDEAYLRALRRYAPFSGER